MFVFLGVHYHHVSPRVCHESLDINYQYVANEVVKTLNVKNWAIVMAANK